MQNKTKILIADDSELEAKVFSTELARGGFEPLLCRKEGRQIIEKINSIRPDVVVLDAFVPGLDAIEIMRRVNSEDQPPIFIVIMSAYSPAIEARLIANGAQYVLIKPVDPSILCDRVAMFTGIDSSLKKGSVNPFETGTPVRLEEMVTDIIHQIGVPAHIKGYHFMREAIILAVENRNIINFVTKELYPTVAKKFSTTASRVERAIRHAIEVAWDRGDVDTLEYYFGFTIQNSRGKPTNSEFIALISDKLHLKLKAAK